MSPEWTRIARGRVAQMRFTWVASRAMPPRRPPSTGSSRYVSLICSSVISTAGAGGAARGRASGAVQPASAQTTSAHTASRWRALTLRDACQPGMVAAAREPLGQVAAGALGVTAAEARLEQRVVKHVALRAAAAQLDDARPQRLDLRNGRRVIALRERVQAFDERRQDVAHEPRRIF